MADRLKLEGLQEIADAISCSEIVQKRVEDISAGADIVKENKLAEFATEAEVEAQRIIDSFPEDYTELIDKVDGLNEDLTQTKADLKAMSTMTSNDDLDYSINGNIVSADFVGYAYKSRNIFDKNNVLVNYYLDSSNKKILPYQTTYTAFAKVNKNTNYTISRAKTSHLYIGFTNEIPNANVSVYDLIGNIPTVSNKTVNSNNYEYIVVWFYWQSNDTSGISYTEALNSLMIEEGNVAHDYEPYGIIKPSGVVESHTKNLLNFDGNLYVSSDNKYIEFNSSKSAIVEVKPNEKYYLSGNVSLLSNSVFRLAFSTEYPNVNVPYTRITSGLVSGGVYTPTEKGYLVVMCYSSHSIDEIKAQLEKGSVATDYEPYKHSEITLPYIPLGVGDIKDELIVYADGTGKFVKRVDSIDMSSLNWLYQSDRTRFVSSDIPNIKYYDNTLRWETVICSRFETKTDDRDKSIYQNGNLVIVRDYAYTNETTFKNSLRGELLYFELATPQEITLTSAEVEQILALKTFADVTYIDADGLAYEIGYLINAGKAIKDLRDTIQSIINVVGGNA